MTKDKKAKNDEVRIFAPDFAAEFRLEARGEGKTKTLVGYPAKFNTRSQNLGGFYETIKPGAFKRTLAEGADVRGLINHDPNLVIGRNTSGTMRLKEDSIGLRMECDLPDTQYARDLATCVDRGDISQGSFRFRVVQDNWTNMYDADGDSETLRELQDVDLKDASVVTFPAYEDTSIFVRSISKAAGLDFERVAGILIRSQHGLEVNDGDRQFLADAIAELEMSTKVSTPLLDRARRRLRLAQSE